MEIQEFTKIVKRLKSFNWRMFFSVVEILGDDCNKRKERFDKASLFERALAKKKISNDVMSWVDDIGHDHLLREDFGKEYKIEMKTQRHCILTKTGKKKKNGLVEVRLSNSLGDASLRPKEHFIRFDHLLIADTGNENSYCAAIIDAHNIKEDWLDTTKDAAILRIPMEALTFVVEPQDFTLKQPKQEIVSYKQRKEEMQNMYLEEVINAVS
jgi:hypothetical protein